ncbi:MAG: hypothetical protein LBN71_03665 [Tannerella sp.]|nr:hypothetical protein [Tannerella sp.]
MKTLIKLTEGIYEKEIYPVSYFSQAFDLTAKIQEDLHQTEVSQIELFGELMNEHQAQILSIAHYLQKPLVSAKAAVQPVRPPVQPEKSPTQPVAPVTSEEQFATPPEQPVVQSVVPATDSFAPPPPPPAAPLQPVEPEACPITPPAQPVTLVTPPVETTVQPAASEEPLVAPVAPPVVPQEKQAEPPTSFTPPPPPPPVFPKQEETVAPVETPVKEEKKEITFTVSAPVQEKKSIADIIPEKQTVSLNDVVERKNLSDLRKAFTLNDRFRFCRELFLYDEKRMNQTLAALNEKASFAASENYLKENFNWNFEDGTVVDFLAMIEKRFV